MSAHCVRPHSRHRKSGGLEPIFFNGFQSQCRSLRLRALFSLAKTAAEEVDGAASNLEFQALLGDAGLHFKDSSGLEVLHVPLLLSEVAHVVVDTRCWVLAVAANGSAETSGSTDHVWLFFVEGDEATMDRCLRALSQLGAVRANLGGDYCLGSKILGMGGSATVHLARPCCREGTVKDSALAAAKVFSREHNLERVHREVRLLLMAQGSAHVIRFHGLFHRDSRDVLLTEFCCGGDVHDRVEGGGVYDETDALELVGGLLSALKYIHSVGVIHRDVNPQNVLITSAGQPLLADFGIAALCSDTKELQVCCGTPGYTAPEVFLPGPYGPKVDVFGAGAFLFFTLFAPTPLFEGRSLKEVKSRTVECQIRFPPRPEVSPATRHLLSGVLLARLPGDRPTAALAAEVLRMLGLAVDDPGLCCACCGREGTGQVPEEGLFFAAGQGSPTDSESMATHSSGGSQGGSTDHSGANLRSPCPTLSLGSVVTKHTDIVLSSRRRKDGRKARPRIRPGVFVLLLPFVELVPLLKAKSVGMRSMHVASSGFLAISSQRKSRSL